MTRDFIIVATRLDLETCLDVQVGDYPVLHPTREAAEAAMPAATRYLSGLDYDALDIVEVEV